MLILSSIQISSLVSATTTVVFSPTDDTMIKNDNPNNPFGPIWYMTVRNAYGDGNKNYYEIDSLINFNIFSIPSTATILSASIHIYYYDWSGTDPAGSILNLYLITSNWNEQYVAWNTRPSYATTPSSSAAVPDSKGQWITWDVTKDVQYLVKERAYYGWIITDENNWMQPNISMVYFRTREYGNYIPYLEVTVSEANKEPISGYSFTPLNPTTKDSIQFTDTSYDSDGTITEWFWNFGDGNSSTSRTPTHTYAQSGQYNVTLQVTDNDGITNSKTAVVSISTPKSTPGFEFLIVLCAIAFVLIVSFKWKKRN
jgi:hypothetical protein